MNIIRDNENLTALRYEYENTQFMAARMHRMHNDVKTDSFLLNATVYAIMPALYVLGAYTVYSVFF